ncbi:diaminopimelate epimerase [Corynebacterium heidelbergense]|uniref:Diaminopimelate epimerase n=1 Tax=Corynebacterium heidelbergense TaxID=2055947 RepID=A0A364VCI7_9CORY|nr:diaminopimelate epimerase [Corynebacterium heidelbergense]RAV34372.1 diaminopimelate epimerase [Corynebacterium heidelbergense]WCZ36688.1 Diaminopimelate epimerase [Corynebacterium heidelbergense]
MNDSRDISPAVGTQSGPPTSKRPALPFIKAHGTRNDFVVLVDPEAELECPPQLVRAMCDRRAGVGADGLIRVARAGALERAGVIPQRPTGCGKATWFMDYRNADGSVAQMCGNGVRVFAHVLVAEGLIPAAEGVEPFSVGTRAGAKRVVLHRADARDAVVSVDMGAPHLLGPATARWNGQQLRGLGVDMGNPHLAVVLEDHDAHSLAQLPVPLPVEGDPEVFPEGLNLELLTPLAGGRAHMRVHERGVGETESCGTGTVAAAVAALAHRGRRVGNVAVSVPGGEVQVSVTEDGSTLTGPSQIVFRGSFPLLDANSVT